jgi:sRNA-binding carbon storage regulator CsrA
MLVITRKLRQRWQFGDGPAEDIIYLGPDIKIQLVRLRNGVAAIGIEAPDSVKILRAEIAEPALRERWGDNGVRGGRR